jgi:hypothetical protein
MRLEAIYEKGRLEFLTPVRFVRDRIKVLVEIPEHEVASTLLPDPDQAPPEYIRDLVLRLDRIRKAPLPQADKNSQATPKQQERFEAFSLRKDQ